MALLVYIHSLPVEISCNTTCGVGVQSYRDAILRRILLYRLSKCAAPPSNIFDVALFPWRVGRQP